MAARGDIALTALTPAEAEVVLAWRYPGPYARYDLTDDALAGLLDPANGYLAIRSAGRLEGFVCTGGEARVPPMQADPAYTDVGMGFAPELTGRGRARVVMPAVLDALGATLGPRPAALRAVIADWNTRARTAVAHCGFAEAETLANDAGGWVVVVRPR